MSAVIIQNDNCIFLSRANAIIEQTNTRIDDRTHIICFSGLNLRCATATGKADNDETRAAGICWQPPCSPSRPTERWELCVVLLSTAHQVSRCEGESPVIQSGV
eukprot:TRINITY_DN66807_c0_g1_i1.p2 TRINITY_DN66807_c0_g1~~TRINITY_DN66807_c0_g1_i1.p2  ORF type:complete len:104 (-),score=3.43 TRINITY_DN66807_c0_g1_i1:19-330(-)